MLATSIQRYEIRIDLVTPSNKNFEMFVKELCDSVSLFNHRSSAQVLESSTNLERNLRKARENKNRYFLLAKNLSYSDYIKFRNFPLLNLGAYKGGLIVEQSTKRNYPLVLLLSVQLVMSEKMIKDILLELELMEHLDKNI